MKRIEEETEKRLKDEFCVCALDRTAQRAVIEYLIAHGLWRDSKTAYIVSRPCPACGDSESVDLGDFDEEERAVWLKLADDLQAAWAETRRTGKCVETPEEWRRLEKWLYGRVRAKYEKAYGKHLRGAYMAAYNHVKKIYPSASDLADRMMRDFDEYKPR